MAHSKSPDKFYKGVSQDKRDELERFRETHPPRLITANGVEWSVIDTERGNQPLLLCLGALALAESSFRTVTTLEGDYRLIVPGYTPLNTMAKLTDGMVAVLDNLGIDQVYVIGGSYGGMVAQVLVRRHPDRIKRLILSHTLLPDPESWRESERSFRMFDLLPAVLLRALIRRSLGRLAPEDDEDSVFMRAYVAEVFMTRLTKQDITALYHRAMDYGLNYTFTPEDLAGWPGAVMIIMDEDDPSTPEPVREAFKKLYPEAEVHIFQGTGHLTSVLKPDEYYGLVRGFLSG